MLKMGEIIAQKRKEMGLTQVELAEKMYVTDKAVSKWERNLANPDIQSINKLAEILNISVNELLTAPKAQKNKEIEVILQLIFKAVALAMGVALLVLSILNEIDLKTGFSLTGVAIISLSIYILNSGKEG